MKTLIIAGFLTFATPALAESVPDMVHKEAMRLGVPPSLALSIAKHESGFRCSAVGSRGERGVMQIKPRTAKSLGYKGSPSGLNNCRIGIHYGMVYLKLAYKKASGNWYRTAALYNGGLGTKRKTSGYAKKVVQNGHPGSSHR